MASGKRLREVVGLREKAGGGGMYIPPFKLGQMVRGGESEDEYQRVSWEALRKSLNGLVNKASEGNIENIIPEFFAENMIRGRGLFCRAILKSQMASPAFTHVFAALVAVINTKFPEIGALLLKRIVLQFKRAYKRNDKPRLLAAVKFIAHLVNRLVAHEIVALEILTVLLEHPTDDSVEISIDFLKQCGSTLHQVLPKALDAIFQRLRDILYLGDGGLLSKRIQVLIENLFGIRRAGFRRFEAVSPQLDLVEQEDQITHEVSLQDEIDPEDSLDIFVPDPNFLENENRYQALKKTILGDDDDDDEEESEATELEIEDATETNLINLRRTIYLIIMSSLGFEEAGHKLMQLPKLLLNGQEMEVCTMLLECLSQERTYLSYYALLARRLCLINRKYQDNFEKCFGVQYSMIHRLETVKLRNVAKFFAELLANDALPWNILAYIRLTEADTTSSSRIFIKVLFLELSEHLGLYQLNKRLSDPAIFPTDNAKDIRFSINFFTSIGLGGLTENMRQVLRHLSHQLKVVRQQQEAMFESKSESEICRKRRRTQIVHCC